jgi:hypothetical protein
MASPPYPRQGSIVRLRRGPWFPCWIGCRFFKTFAAKSDLVSTIKDQTLVAQAIDDNQWDGPFGLPKNYQGCPKVNPPVRTTS